jgi:hypothetical protein
MNSHLFRQSLIIRCTISMRLQKQSSPHTTNIPTKAPLRECDRTVDLTTVSSKSVSMSTIVYRDSLNNGTSRRESSLGNQQELFPGQFRYEPPRDRFHAEHKLDKYLISLLGQVNIYSYQATGELRTYDLDSYC